VGAKPICMYAKPPAYLLESSPFNAVYTLAGNLAALEPGEKVAILRVRETQQRLGRLSALGGIKSLPDLSAALQLVIIRFLWRGLSFFVLSRSGR